MLCAVNAGGNAQCKRVADPDPQMRGEGGSHPDTKEIRGGGVVLKFFSAFESQFDPKIRGGRAPRAPPLDPPPQNKVIT